MGSAAELNQFLASVEKRAYAMAVTSVKEREDALDIVQDVMMTLARKYARKPSDQWPPLFFRILNNRITDYHRSRNLRRRFFGWLDTTDNAGEDPFDQVPGPQTNDPDRRNAIDGATDELQRALAQLPLRQQQAFMLRAWEGLDVKATAQAMGCSDGSVKTHYSRAVHTLRTRLEEHYDG